MRLPVHPTLRSGILSFGCFAAVLLAEPSRAIGSAGSSFNPGAELSGIHAGQFTLHPTAELSVASHSNIFADERDEKSDLITRYQAGAALESHWKKHDMRVFGSINEQRFLDNSSEDATNYDLGVEGRLDVSNRTAVLARVTERKYTLDRSSVESAFGEDRQSVKVSGLNLDIRHQFGQWQTTLSGQIGKDNYDDSVLSSNLTNQRDREIRSVGGRLTRQQGPKPNYYIDLALTDTNYDRQAVTTDFDRSNDGFAISVGKHFNRFDALLGQVQVGYFKKDYAERDIQRVSGLFTDGRVTWKITGLTSVTVRGLRSFSETTLNNSAGGTAVEFGLVIDHELLRSLRLQASANLIKSDFDGIDREETDRLFELSASYDLGRWALLRFFHRFEHRQSSGSNAGRDFDVQIFGLSISDAL